MTISVFDLRNVGIVKARVVIAADFIALTRRVNADQSLDYFDFGTTAGGTLYLSP
ncbi:MAG TPA: hypothetical protein VL793_14835 [Patescibacteria group bacterium]|nr:hypothetical protein [Patescibacteria group bacterium]